MTQFQSWSAIAILVCLSACEWSSSSKSSVLVIAVDSLGAHDVSCRSDETTEGGLGFRSFCNEGLRFTHAYTPSTQTTAALASLLTGLFPFEHGVHHNGSQFLLTKFKTASEQAIEQNFVTGFFSGGPPVFFKSGLGQGFQVFDDAFGIQEGQSFRPAKSTVHAFLKWLREQKGAAFFATVYLSDLQFHEWMLPQDELASKELNPSANADEVESAVGELVKVLKAQKQWDKTHIILVGTRGHEADQQQVGEPPGLALTREQTHVALFIKPATTPRDLGMTWKSDQNVSLVDVGQTILEILGAPKNNIPFKGQQVSLLQLMLGQDLQIAEDRPILMETGWPQWRALGLLRFALRIGEYVVVHDTNTKVFNTLVDHFEANPVHEHTERSRFILDTAKSIFVEQKLEAWSQPSRSVLTRFSLAAALMRNNVKREQTIASLQQVLRTGSSDPYLVHWLAEAYADSESWTDLRSLSQQYRLPVWGYVAEQNLARKSTIPDDPCVLLVLRPQKTESKENWNLTCDDEQTILFAQWVHSRDKDIKERAREQLIRSLRTTWMDRELTRQNYLSGLMWDTKLATNSQLSRLEVLLHLPPYRRLSVGLKRRIKVSSNSKE